MNYNKQCINILRIINNSSKPLRTDKDFSDSDVQLIIQLEKEDYITGNYTYTNTLPITNIRPTIKGRKYQEELEQKELKPKLNTKMRQQTIMSKTSIIDKIKTVINKHPSIISVLKLNYKWLAFIVLIITVLLFINNIKTKSSYSDSILNEINRARGMLDYTLLQRQQNVRTRPVFSLAYQNYIPDSFADNLPLKTKLIDLYQSLLSAQKSAEELMFLLSQDDSDSLTIKNIESQIRRVIKSADKVGPQVAEYIGKTWQIPLVSMSQQEKIKYYERTWIFNSTSTDTNISSPWQINK